MNNQGMVNPKPGRTAESVAAKAQRRFRMAILTIRHTVASAESKSPRSAK